MPQVVKNLDNIDSSVNSVPLIRVQDIQRRDYAFIFAVSHKTPLFQYLSYYGQDVVDYFVWIRFGRF